MSDVDEQKDDTLLDAREVRALFERSLEMLGQILDVPQHLGATADVRRAEFWVQSTATCGESLFGQMRAGEALALPRFLVAVGSTFAHVGDELAGLGPTVAGIESLSGELSRESRRIFDPVLLADGTGLRPVATLVVRDVMAGLIAELDSLETDQDPSDFDVDAWAAGFVGLAAPALLSAFERLTAGHEPDSIVSLGAYSDSDAGTLVVAAETGPHWKRNVDSYPDARGSFRWEPEEWALNGVDLLESGAVDDLAAVSGELERARAAAVAGGHLDSFRSVAWQAMVDALHHVFEDGSLRRWPAAVHAFTVSDHGTDVATAIGWHRSINTSVVGDEYEQYARAVG